MPHANVLAHRQIANELGLIGEWLEERGWTHERMWREDFPVLPEADALIVLGSLDSVASGHCAGWAPAEMSLIRDWIDEGRRYLGVCFGAQILASIWGARWIGGLGSTGKWNRSPGSMERHVGPGSCGTRTSSPRPGQRR